MADLTGKTLGRYRILERIGRGGMAEVYKGYQPSLDRYVAVKVLHAFLLEEADGRDRFRREARAVAALRHPNIIQVFDFDDEGDVYFMVMEFIQGPNLKTVLQEHAAGGTRLSLARIEEIVTAIGGALAYAHHQGMIHRDVKPHNIMFTAEGQPLLTDFGIAKIVSGSNVSTSGALSGTPAYMSPEQGRAEPLDQRTDIYSLGVVLYEMATGRVPFDADTPFAVVIKHINDPLPLPRTVDSGIPESLERVILKVMAKDPAERFQTAEEMVTATREVIAGAGGSAQAGRPAPPVPTPVPVVTHPLGGGGPALPGALVPNTAHAPNAPPRMRALARLGGNRLSCSVAVTVLALVLLVGTGGLLGAFGNASSSTTGGAPPPTAPIVAAERSLTPDVPSAVAAATGGGSPIAGAHGTVTLTPATVAPPVPSLGAMVDGSPTVSAPPAPATVSAPGTPGAGAADLLAAKRYSEALAAFDAVLETDPFNAAALRGRGLALLSLERYGDAASTLTQALAARPDDVELRLARAQANAGAGNWDAALGDATQVLARDKTSIPALIVHAQASLAREDRASAVADYDAVVAAHAQDPAAYRARAAFAIREDRPADAVKDLMQALTLAPQDADLWTDLGNAYVTYAPDYEQQPDAALEAYARALKINPRLTRAYYARAQIIHHRDLESGLADVNKALEIGPATAEMYYLRSQIDESLGNEQTQRADLDNAIAVDPKQLGPYAWRIEYNLRHGQYAAAVADQSRVVALLPQPDQYAGRSELYLLAGDYENAAADARRVIAAAPDAADGYRALAAVLFVQHDYAAALKHADAAVQRAPDNDSILALRGRIYVRLGDPDKAAADFAAALKAYEFSGPAFIGLAELALRREQPDVALGYLDKWENADGFYGWGFVLRARIEEARHDLAKARQALAPISRRILFPDEREAAAALAAKLSP